MYSLILTWIFQNAVLTLGRLRHQFGSTLSNLEFLGKEC